MEDIDRIINELHLYEKKVLKSLESSKKSLTPEEVVNTQKLDIKSVMSAAGSLASKDIIDVRKDIEETLSLSDDGENYAQEGLPERKLLNLLQQEGSVHMKDLGVKSGLNPSDVKIGVGWLVRKQWAKINQGEVTITDNGKEMADNLQEDEKLLSSLLEKGQMSLNVLDHDLQQGFKLLKSRKGLIDIDKNTSHTFILTDKGQDILAKGIVIQEEATQLTHQQLKSGDWKSLKYRGYDVKAEYPEFNLGKMHPLRRIIEEIRNVFLNLGFDESKGPILESAFWNFDCLFQPQDHAAREMQDTFYIKNPSHSQLPDENLVSKVAQAHQDGGDTGSEGWGYLWDKEVARQSVLRTHTTGVSARFLAENEPPLKMFSVGKVFRRETITYKHLPEFHQVEGIVAGDEINFRNLLGILKEFYKKLGFEVRFRPAYFPYTYLSTECEIYLPEKESWIELGGAGMFRPEVLEPLGIETPVAAFGLGIERLAMIRLGIKDIRMLYKSDMGWLRKLPITQGVDIED
ncbi:MAG: phenylalanine--tRNA ligase subunit alpha [Methanobacteriales archaeon HGW-Methanobacteriales-1]|jgi:phenylalanyl-tRNA synthetase alpha chain|nr:MAG: phenylalanine--tRNA ligase subunit alpha [Methanobacteriales archaeon HGW-Methanobacteriales-1]